MTPAILAAAAWAAAPTVTPLRAWRADLAEPTRIAADADGNVYISDPARGEVAVRAVDGRLVARWTGLGYPVAVGLDSAGRLLVGDAADGSVSGWTAPGDAACVLGGGAGEFVLPADLSADPATGRVYVADSLGGEVRVYGADCGYQGSFDGSDGPSGPFGLPVAVFAGGDGVVVVVDQGARRVRLFDPDGAALSELGEEGDEADQLYAPAGAWRDEAGRTWVTDARHGVVLAFEDDGAVVATAGGAGSGPGQLRTPSDLASDGTGRLFVASTSNARVEVFGIDDFEDPEAWAPARASIDPSTLTADETEADVVVAIPGYRAIDVDLDTLRANGVGPLEASAGDADGDGEPDVRARFDLGSTLPAKGVGAVMVEGTVFPSSGKALAFEEALLVEVVAVVEEDTGEVPDSAEDDDSGAPPATGSSRRTPRDGCGCAHGPAALLLPLAFAGPLRRRGGRR